MTKGLSKIRAVFYTVVAIIFLVVFLPAILLMFPQQPNFQMGGALGGYGWLILGAIFVGICIGIYGFWKSE